MACQLKLNGSSDFVLDNRGPGQNITTLGNVADAQADEVASPELAVDCQVKERKVPNTALS